MPTTPAGNTYTPEYGTTADGSACRWYMDDTRHGDTGIPLVVFVHGSGGNVESFDHAGWSATRNLLIDSGWAIVEGDGGGPANWGAHVARAAYVEMVDWVETMIDTGPIVVIGQSMGGLCSTWLASGAPFADRVIGLVVQNGTVDLAKRYAAAADGAEARAFNIAYGLGALDAKDIPAFTVASAGFDPMLFPTADWAGKRVLHNWSLADPTVPPDRNGVAWVSKYGPHTAETRTHVNATGGHYVTSADSAAVVAFMGDLMASLSPEPETPVGRGVVYLVQGMSLVGADRRLYPIDAPTPA